MRTGFALLVCVALGSCGEGVPQDCDVADAQGVKCLERYEGKSDRQMLLRCFPFSPPERIEGAWVRGFETNEFYEGERASRQLINKDVGGTQLDLEDEEQLGATPRIFQIDFVGRRSRCDMGFPRNVIVIERIDSRKEIAGP